jgi:hypothetical protein
MDHMVAARESMPCEYRTSHNLKGSNARSTSKSGAVLEHTGNR